MSASRWRAWSLVQKFYKSVFSGTPCTTFTFTTFTTTITFSKQGGAKKGWQPKPWLDTSALLHICSIVFRSITDIWSSGLVPTWDKRDKGWILIKLIQWYKIHPRTHDNAHNDAHLKYQSSWITQIYVFNIYTFMVQYPNVSKFKLVWN